MHSCERLQSFEEKSRLGPAAEPQGIPRQPDRPLTCTELPVTVGEHVDEPLEVLQPTDIRVTPAEHQLGGASGLGECQDPGVILHVIEDLRGDRHPAVLVQADQHRGLREQGGEFASGTKPADFDMIPEALHARDRGDRGRIARVETADIADKLDSEVPGGQPQLPNDPCRRAQQEPRVTIEVDRPCGTPRQTVPIGRARQPGRSSS